MARHLEDTEKATWNEAVEACIKTTERHGTPVDAGFLVLSMRGLIYQNVSAPPAAPAQTEAETRMRALIERAASLLGEPPGQLDYAARCEEWLLDIDRAQPAAAQPAEPVRSGDMSPDGVAVWRHPPAVQEKSEPSLDVRAKAAQECPTCEGQGWMQFGAVKNKCSTCNGTGERLAAQERRGDVFHEIAEWTCRNICIGIAIGGHDMLAAQFRAHFGDAVAALEMIGRHPCHAADRITPLEYHCGECAACVAKDALARLRTPAPGPGAGSGEKP